MAEKYPLDFEKKLKKSNDDYRTGVENGTIDEVSIISPEKKSKNETIREEFIEKKFWFKRILNWQNIRKKSISIVKRI
ncbi:MAG: hypothetical protein O8C68_02490 [Candidatus Methanoperedens sp.]|jgi:hypothetical protein|nr:hypothetical protein [Candidatus Methanoperedens sp.]MCZ7394671.1 hypothetical protein [Candidatus Methanoperedens sp.]